MLERRRRDYHEDRLALVVVRVVLSRTSTEPPSRERRVTTWFRHFASRNDVDVVGFYVIDAFERRGDGASSRTPRARFSASVARARSDGDGDVGRVARRPSR
jgi:hypothetical protein